MNEEMRMAKRIQCLNTDPVKRNSKFNRYKCVFDTTNNDIVAHTMNI